MLGSISQRGQDRRGVPTSTLRAAAERAGVNCLLSPAQLRQLCSEYPLIAYPANTETRDAQEPQVRVFRKRVPDRKLQLLLADLSQSDPRWSYFRKHGCLPGTGGPVGPPGPPAGESKQGVQGGPPGPPSGTTDGSSGLGPKLGYSKYRSNCDEWALEAGFLGQDAQDAHDLRFCKHGHCDEPLGGKMFAIVMQCQGTTATAGMCMCRQRPAEHTSPDVLVRYLAGIVHHPLTRNDRLYGVGENKGPLFCVHCGRVWTISPHTIPPEYVLQQQHQMDVLRHWWQDLNALRPQLDLTRILEQEAAAAATAASLSPTAQDDDGKKRKREEEAEKEDSVGGKRQKTLDSMWKSSSSSSSSASQAPLQQQEHKVVQRPIERHHNAFISHWHANREPGGEAKPITADQLFHRPSVSTVDDEKLTKPTLALTVGQLMVTRMYESPELQKAIVEYLRKHREAVERRNRNNTPPPIDVVTGQPREWTIQEIRGMAPRRIHEPDLPPVDLLPLKWVQWFLHEDAAIDPALIAPIELQGKETLVQHYTIHVATEHAAESALGKAEGAAEQLIALDPLLWPKDWTVAHVKRHCRFMTVVVHHFVANPLETVTLKQLQKR